MADTPLTSQALQGAQGNVSQDELFRRYLDGDTSLQLLEPSQSTSMMATNVPDVRNIAASPAGEVVTPEASARSRFRQGATRPGVELDVESGAPAWLRLQAGAIRAKEDQLEFWRQKYGQDKVDVVNGQFVLRGVADEKGKVRDILVDEERLSGKDVLDMLGEAPELALSIFAARKMAAQKAGLLGQSLMASAAYSATGAVKDLGTRRALDQPLRPGEIAAARGAEGATDLLLSAVAPVFKGVVNLMRGTPFATSSVVPLEGMMAREKLLADTGIDIPMSLAERTGNQALARGESYASRIIFAGRPIQQAKEAKIQAIRNVQDMLMEGVPPSSTEVGQRATSELAKPLKTQQQSVDLASQAAQSSAQAQAQAQLTQRVGLSQSALDIGEGLAAAAQGRLDAVKQKAKVLYEDVYALPESKQDVFPLKAVAEKAKEILKKLPSVPDQPKTVKSSLVDEFGREQNVTIPGKPDEREHIRELIKSELMGRLEALSQRGNQSTRLFDLVQMRDRIWDLTGTGAIQDIPTKDLKEISSAITQAINEGAEKIGGGFKAKLDKANEFYKTNIPQFDQPGVKELLSKEEGIAAKRDSLVQSIFASGKGSEGRYQQLKGLLGDNNAAIKNLQQYFLDNILEKDVKQATQTIEFSKVLDSIKKLSPSVKKDLFGAGADNLEDVARLGLVAEGKVSFDEVKNLIQSNQLTRSKVNALVREQEKLDDLLKNQVNAGIKEGFIDTTKLNPDEFVERFILNPKIPTKDVRASLSTLAGGDDPEILQDVRRKVLEEMFRKSQRISPTGVAGGEDITRRISGDVTRELDPQKFSMQFDDREQVARLKEVLTPKQFERATDLAKVLAASGRADTLAGAAGAMGSGGILKDLVTSFQGMADVSRFYLFSKILTDDRIVRTLTQAKTPLEMQKTMQALILTPEVARTIVDDFPNEMERERVVEDLRNHFKIDEFAAQLLLTPNALGGNAWDAAQGIGKELSK